MNIILIGIVLALCQVGFSVGAFSFFGSYVGLCVFIGLAGFILGSLFTTWWLTKPVFLNSENLEGYLKSKGFRKVIPK